MYDNEESLEAYASIQEVRGIQRAQVLAFYQSTGAQGAIRDEASAALRMKHQSVTARVNDLLRDGELVETVERRLTSSRRPARVLVAVEFASQRTDIAPIEKEPESAIVAVDVDDPRYYLKQRLFQQALGALILDAAPATA